MSMREPERPIIRPVMPELDSLRGIAALSVIFYHGLFWSDDFGQYHGFRKAILLASKPGWLGVNLFFVLSGFLITGILLNAKERPRFFSTFYKRRALRILPAYFALLVILLLDKKPLSFIGLSAVFSANMTFFFDIPMAFGPLWSLAVEEHFYLVWPAVVRFCSRTALTVISLGIVVASPFLRGYRFQVGRGIETFSVTWLVADGLATGALVALFLRSRLGTRSNAARLAWGSVLLSLVIGAAGLPFGIDTRNTLPGAMLQVVPWNLLFGGTLIFSLLLGSRHERPVRVPVLPFFGFISYGLYLVHQLVFEFYDKAVGPLPAGDFTALLIRFAVCAVVSIAIASMSRFTYEEWFLRMKEHPATPPQGLGTSERKPAIDNSSAA